MADIQLLNNQGITVFKHFYTCIDYDIGILNSFENIQVFKSLEQCFSGGVYLGYKGDTGLVSVKVRNIDQVGERELDAIERFKEMEAIPFVSQYKEIIKLEKQIIILNDFANMKSIEHIIKNKYSLSSGTFRALAKQIFEGIRYINSIDIILRDINAENLLLHCPHGSNRVIVKIAGFECAKVLGKYQTNNLEQEDKSFKIQQFGFRQNMAPELDIEGEKADSRVDGWSSGVVLFQLAGHDHPIKAKTIDELKKPAAIQDDQLWDLLTHLLDFNRKTRYSAELALQHPYFTSPSFEISAEANEIAIQSLYDKQQGDKSITIYDQDSTYIVPKSEIKAALEYDPDIDLQPIYHQIQQQQIIGSPSPQIILSPFNQNQQQQPQFPPLNPPNSAFITHNFSPYPILHAHSSKLQQSNNNNQQLELQWQNSPKYDEQSPYNAQRRQFSSQSQSSSDHSIYPIDDQLQQIPMNIQPKKQQLRQQQLNYYLEKAQQIAKQMQLSNSEQTQDLDNEDIDQQYNELTINSNQNQQNLSLSLTPSNLQSIQHPQYLNSTYPQQSNQQQQQQQQQSTLPLPYHQRPQTQLQHNSKFQYPQYQETQFYIEQQQQQKQNNNNNSIIQTGRLSTNSGFMTSNTQSRVDKSMLHPPFPSLITKTLSIPQLQYNNNNALSIPPFNRSDIQYSEQQQDIQQQIDNFSLIPLSKRDDYDDDEFEQEENENIYKVNNEGNQEKEKEKENIKEFHKKQKNKDQHIDLARKEQQKDQQNIIEVQKNKEKEKEKEIQIINNNDQNNQLIRQEQQKDQQNIIEVQKNKEKEKEKEIQIINNNDQNNQLIRQEQQKDQQNIIEPQDNIEDLIKKQKTNKPIIRKVLKNKQNKIQKTEMQKLLEEFQKQNMKGLNKIIEVIKAQIKLEKKNDRLLAAKIRLDKQKEENLRKKQQQREKLNPIQLKSRSKQHAITAHHTFRLPPQQNPKIQQLPLKGTQNITNQPQENNTVQCPFCTNSLPIALIEGHIKSRIHSSHPRNNNSIHEHIQKILPQMNRRPDGGFESKADQQIDCPFCNQKELYPIEKHINNYHINKYNEFQGLLNYHYQLNQNQK